MGAPFRIAGLDADFKKVWCTPFVALSRFHIFRCDIDGLITVPYITECESEVITHAGKTSRFEIIAKEIDFLGPTDFEFSIDSKIGQMSPE
jgi:hypothetical protein